MLKAARKEEEDSHQPRLGSRSLSKCTNVARAHARRTHPFTGAGILHGVDNTELVQHFAHDDDAHPDGRQTGSEGPEGAVGRGQRPQHHQDQVHQRWLQTATKRDLTQRGAN